MPHVDHPPRSVEDLRCEARRLLRAVDGLYSGANCPRRWWMAYDSGQTVRPGTAAGYDSGRIVRWAVLAIRLASTAAP